jgi:hypothetical protein
LNAEAPDFPQFIRAREQSLQRTAWLLTGDWALAEDRADRCAVPAAVGTDQPAGRSGGLRPPRDGQYLII